MTRLSVNLNKIALLRNSRGRDFPSVTSYADKCLRFGAGGITVHPRPDERHIRYDDITPLGRVVKEYEGREFNIEGYPDQRFIDLVMKNIPDQCTLVPDEPGQLTSDHGWDLSGNIPGLKQAIEQLKSAGIRVSLFLDPDRHQVDLAKKIDADRIELYTESYAASYNTKEGTRVFNRYREAAVYAGSIGLGVNAGHDLNLSNLQKFLQIPDILEVSIGHALTVEAIDRGLESTIAEYLQIVKQNEG